MNYKNKIYFYFIFFYSIFNAQNYIPGNSFNLLEYEKELFINERFESLIIRPVYNKLINSKWNFRFRNEIFINDGNPNLENMDNRWVGGGMGWFSSLDISYFNNFLSFTIEPYYYINQNKLTKNLNRNYSFGNFPDIFNVLNDVRYFQQTPYKIYGLRQSHFFLHYQMIGIGFSNANMWWGPGIHTSLTMTNNTTGFPHLMIGTLNERRFKNIGLDIRYIIGKLDKTSGNPYYTALVWTAKFYSKPIITIGLSRNFISGGNTPHNSTISKWNAALLPFQGIFIDGLIDVSNIESGGHDDWDQTMAGYFILDYPKSQLRLFIELATDDHRQNLIDLRSQPDHNSASIFGLRKYNLFSIEDLIFGFEYANIRHSYTNKFRGGGHWWWKGFYSYSSYNGRRWAAHSGSDSDDFYIFISFKKNNFTFIPAFNYERHGIVVGNPPEVKIEFRFDIRFDIKNYQFNLFYEKEFFRNIEFDINNKVHSNVIWFGIEKDLRSILSNNSKK